MAETGVKSNVEIKMQLWLIVLTALFSACASPPDVRKAVVPTPGATPLRTDAIVLDKPIKVSFSTYSTDWPVGWEWIDPEEKYNATPHDVKSGALRIRLKSRKQLAGEDRTAPRYVKAITGDFQIETRVKFYPTQDFQGAGLLVYANDANYLIFERAYGGDGGGGGGLRLDRQTPDGYAALVTPKDIQSDAREIELKLVRNGGAFSAFWREEESGEWREAGQVQTDYPETIIAGLIARNTASETTADFRYIYLLPTIQ